MTSAYVDDSLAKHSLRFADITHEQQQMLLPVEGYQNMPLVSLECAVEPLVHLLPQIQRKVWMAKQTCATPSGRLSSDESASICLCSMEWEPQDECLHFALNATLCDRDRTKLKPWFLYLRLLLTALARLPSTRLTVYRGVTLDLTNDYPEGKTFVWWGFSSCTSSIKVLQSEQFLREKRIRTMFVIDCHSGKDIRQYSYYDKENEILLLCATQFQVVASLIQENSLHVIQLKEIDPLFSLIQPVSVPDSPIDHTNKITTPTPNIYCNPQLEKLIAQCHYHSNVHLTSQQLTDRDMEIVIKQAIVNKRCSKLDLDHNHIGPEGASILAAALNNNTTLKKLKLYNNRVSDNGVESLTQTLTMDNCNLKKLTLGKNGITDNGARDLAEMLKSNTTLTHLYLDYNEISDIGVRLLANVLAHHNITLEVLFLNGNKWVTDLSVNPLVEMLEHNESLKELHAYDCHLSKTGKSSIRKAVKGKKGFSLMVSCLISEEKKEHSCLQPTNTICEL